VKGQALQRANETIQAEFGVVDILINAAGGNHPSATTKPDLSFFDLPLDTLRHVGDLNLLGTILPCRDFGRVLSLTSSGSPQETRFLAVVGASGSRHSCGQG
jgi:Dehydrogenases with different specificities (related to short-chain alcohol dehydrogenases)